MHNKLIVERYVKGMQKVYEVMDMADTAYIMHKGKIIFEISPNDQYQLEGKEIIFGAEEPLIAYYNEREEYFRFQTVYVDDDSIVDRIPLDNLIKVISIYNIGYTITRNIARFVQITNKMFINKEKKLSGKEMASKVYASIYVDIVDQLKNYLQKFKLSWLRQLIDRYSNSLVYTKGLAFRKSTARSDLKLDIEKLQEYTFNLRAGSILCEEGDKNNEMFILNRGNLEVYVGGKKVVDINKAGTVMGEMALLLGEKRTATIKTITDCNITIIKPENLKEVAQNSKNFFLNIAVNLGKRLEHNCNLIRETNELIQESVSAGKILPPSERTNYKELLSVIRELERYEVKYKNEWLSSLLQKVKKEITEIRETFS